MPVNKKYLSVFESGNTYHVYNRTNNKELLFKTNDDYYLFLNRLFKYIGPVAEVYAWNLIPNHFHFLIKVRSESEIIKGIESMFDLTKSQKLFLENRNIDSLVEMEFRRLFTSYAMSFNYIHNRNGNLFHRTFRRVRIEREDQFVRAIIYIHANALKHRLVDQFDKYPWTSYHLIISDQPTKLMKKEIIELFGSKEEFISLHKEVVDYYYSFS